MLLLAASVITIFKNVTGINSPVISETIPPKGIPTAGHVAIGLNFRINSEGISFVLPDCDATAWQDNIFIHLYTNGVRNNSAEDFTNLDFNLNEEVNKTSKEKVGNSCHIYKSFGNFQVKSAAIGQYSTPGGRCCDITWSRFYILDSGLAKK
ncbi:MAG: hypothetical protein ABI410_22480 [Rhodoferax sp.]|uniref:hypothetical protein n=1 Tax=Rhodoferax sp. TaxID=50421 RepID=UPI00326323B5